MKTLILIVSVVCLLSNCEKEKVDYSEKYLGSWEFNVITKYYIASIPDNQIDTMNYIGKMQKTSSINQIYIQYLQDRNVTTTVNEKGELFFTYENCKGNLKIIILYTFT